MTTTPCKDAVETATEYAQETYDRVYEELLKNGDTEEISREAAQEYSDKKYTEVYNEMINDLNA